MSGGRQRSKREKAAARPGGETLEARSADFGLSVMGKPHLKMEVAASVFKRAFPWHASQ